MISKHFRLKEKEVKKVLQRGKPFFSYGIVLNYTKNKLSHNRFAIVIGSKSVINNVQRTYFRRRFYDLVTSFVQKQSNQCFYDFVFVVKKQTKLNAKDESSFLTFKKDIHFLLGKIFNTK